MQPIFIGGCERSGTTLLGGMLGSHREYLCVPEMLFKFDICRLAADDGDARVDAPAVLHTLARRSKFRLWELAGDLATVPHERLTARELVEWLVKAYGNRLGRATPRFWVDHTPRNIRYARTLFDLCPDARMVHLVRDGRAVAASILPLDWGPNSIGEAARFWAERLAYGFAAEARWPGQVVRVRYEDLIEDPLATLQRLCAAWAIPFDPVMCRGNGFRVPHYTAAQHALVGQTPDPARGTDWQRQLTRRQIEIFESTTTDMLALLGYAPIFGLRARKASRRESLGAGLQELTRAEVVNRYRKWRRKRRTIAPRGTG